MGIKRKGFTLVEVLIAMSVGTIVIGIAYTLMMMSGIEAKRTDSDVALRQEIRFLQEALYHDLQYQDISGLSEDNGTYSVSLAGGGSIAYAFSSSSKSLIRTGADGSVRTFLKGELDSFTMEEVTGDELESFRISFTASGRDYSLDVAGRLRAGSRGFGYVVPPEVISNPNYLLYIDFEKVKLVWLKDVNGVMIEAPEILEVLPDRIEIVQTSVNSKVNVNLYRGTVLLNTYVYNEGLAQFNGKGSASNGPMLFVEGMVRDTLLDLSVVNNRSLSGANAALSIEYRYSGEMASSIQELKFNNSSYDIR